MDKVNLERNGKPLQIRSGHTPPLRWLLLGCLVAAVPAIITASARSQAVSRVLPLWALYVFYGVLLLSAAVALVGVWRPLPHHLDADTYRLILRRLVWERVGLYGVGGIMSCFAFSTLAANGWNGLPGAAVLGGIAIGLVGRGRQTVEDVNKLHRALDNGVTTGESLLTDPDWKAT